MIFLTYLHQSLLLRTKSVLKDIHLHMLSLKLNEMNRALGHLCAHIG